MATLKEIERKRELKARIAEERGFVKTGALRREVVLIHLVLDILEFLVEVQP